MESLSNCKCLLPILFQLFLKLHEVKYYLSNFPATKEWNNLTSSSVKIILTKSLENPTQSKINNKKGFSHNRKLRGRASSRTG